MAKNQVFKYVDTLSVPVDPDTKSGDPVILNADLGLVGVAETDAGRDETDPITADTAYNGGNVNGYASVTLKGAYAFEVTGAVEPLDAVYITGAGELTTTAGSDVRFGYSLTTKGSGAGLVTVVIDGAPASA